MDHPDDALVEEQEDPTMKNTLASFIQKQQERSLNREMYVYVSFIIMIILFIKKFPSNSS